ncbi:DUF3348 family protein [Marinobacter sp. NP-4(2019)]|uniref:DUF3348 family protein n=1 Tax=Marinobacter sp. NP-4(2019) TaxID=2488665 RepID=UPI000FC3DE63|nr:DUF3348 family protein [Marinobacter sp. NP-4(2019)]AZT84946.1 DUF3348 family protein [Marinobacter sp. NP-4(2019)]
MTQTNPRHTGHSRSRLLRLAAPSGGAIPDDTLPCFAERLGRLFGLGNTMSLDAALSFRGGQPTVTQSAVVERLSRELATTRQALIGRIHGYGDDIEREDPVAFETYLNSWLTLQRKIAATTRQLRDKVRKDMKNQGQALARLAELDSVFDHTMAGYTSQCFSQISKVLEQRFQALMTSSGQHREPDTQSGDPLHRYCEEAQNLLIAELDVRLEPVLGLLEACYNEVSDSL